MVMNLTEKSKGFWSGRKGLDKIGDENQPKRALVLEDIEQKIRLLLVKLAEIESALDFSGEVLKICQPTNFDGRYGLRWWRTSKNDFYTEPVLVRWKRMKNGAMTPTPVVIAKVSENKAFKLNSDNTQKCLNIIQGLIKKRAEIKNRISTLKKSLHQLDGLSYFINNEMQHLQEIKDDAINRLISAGYEIEHDILE